jgi:hypothetical protein
VRYPSLVPCGQGGPAPRPSSAAGQPILPFAPCEQPPKVLDSEPCSGLAGRHSSLLLLRRPRVRQLALPLRGLCAEREEPC